MNTKGFTLIEVIITLVLFSFVATMILPFFRTGVLESHKPIERLELGSILNSAMELIIKDFEGSSKDSSAKSTLISKINAFSTNYIPNCPECTICTPTTVNGSFTIGGLNNALLVTITCTDQNSGESEKISHVFAIEN